MLKRIFGLVVLALVAVIGRADCANCHADQAASMSGTAHAAVGNDCASCHVGGEAHAKDPLTVAVLAFVNESRFDKDAACGSCHVEQHAPPQSAHAQAGLACSDCHNGHAKPVTAATPVTFERLAPGSAACVGCHEDVLASFAFTKRHRLHENSVTCASCHDPHGAPERLRLGAFKQERCTTCHADAGGPFVFEHAASRVDGCLACHAPHGSPNRFLLTHQRVGEQCYSCHAEVVQFHLGFSPSAAPRFGLDTNCTNCHSTIHGSNLDPNFLK